MSPRTTYEGATRGRVLDFWTRREDFGKPVGCLASTYTFDGDFFEKECLGRFVGMETDPDEAGRAYIIEREEKFSEIFAGVFVDRGNAAPHRSLRWHQLAVRPAGTGILHAKVTLIAWEKRIRVLVSSSNLTKWGYRKNYENFAVFDSTESGGSQPILPGVAVFFEDLYRLVSGTGRGGGPAGQARRFLSTVRTIGAKFGPLQETKQDPRTTFITTGPGRPSLFKTLEDEVWKGAGASWVDVVSPFYDEGQAAEKVEDALLAAMAFQGERTIRFVSRGRRNPDKSVDLEIPAVYQKPRSRRVTHEFAFVPDRDDEGNERPLHSKALWMERDSRAVLVLGSSNFTNAGTGLSSSPNIEANVAFSFPDSAAAARNRFGTCLPPFEEVDIDGDDVRFVAVDRVSEGLSELDLLPARFRDALFDPGTQDGQGGRLLLTVNAGEPEVFSLFTLEDERISAADSVSWPAEAASVEWAHTKPPSALYVTWEGVDKRRRKALWVVNVVDTGLLPPPDELRDLPLEVLVEVLSSSRPLHETLSEREPGNGARPSRGAPVDLDPHRKVDTSGFLLKRVQRVSQALEGLAERLAAPAYSMDALQWRLFGPIGPRALARQLRAAEGTSAAFLIAELALTVKNVDWSMSERILGRDAVRKTVSELTRELKDLASDESADASLKAYVSTCFEEALP